MMPNFVVNACQIIVYPIVYFPFRIFYKKELIKPQSFKRGEKYIFVANHPRRIDPFYMFYILPFKEVIKVFPLRFMTAQKYMNNIFYSFFLSLMGCYKIHEGVLEDSIKLLNNGNNLCIFIQGKMEDGSEITPKIGAVYIEREVRNSFLVPVKINYLGKKLRKIAKITYKNKFRHNKFPKNLQPLTNKLLKYILK